MTRNGISSPNLLQPISISNPARNVRPSQLFHKNPKPIFPPKSKQKRPLCPVPSNIAYPTKACRETSAFPRTFHTLSPHHRLTRNANSAKHNSNTTLARRWNVARAVLFHFSRMRNAKDSLLSRVYREGQSPCRTLKGGQGGTIRRFPLLLSLPFQRERKK